METTITSKGQVVIPAVLRRKYGLVAGTRFAVRDRGGKIILEPVTREYMARLRGMLGGGGGLRELERDRARERDL